MRARVPLRHVTLVLLLAIAPAAAQDPPKDTQMELAPRADDYRVGPGDVLAVSVAGVRELTHSGRVSNSGKIHLPFLGIVRVADMTVRQLESLFADMLRTRGLIEAPWVSVSVLEYRSQPVYILGEVMLPGQFVMKREMYLTDLIGMAAGFNEVASPVGYLFRRKTDTENLAEGEAPADEAIPIDFQALNEGRNPELNYRLRGGDVLYVPQAPKRYFYVVGDVRRAGAFKLERDDVLASRALALAGGALRTAKLSKGVLVRLNENGVHEERPLDFNAILRGRKPDVLVQADDVIFIPGSKAKTFAQALLGEIPNAVSNRIIGETIK